MRFKMKIHSILGNELMLLPEKAIFWQKEAVLFLADVHLGKAMHFRTSGIPVPEGLAEKNLEIIKNLINRLSPKRVIVLGDFFHSSLNDELIVFTKYFDNQSFRLEIVVGNHDKKALEALEKFFILHHQPLILPPFICSHEPMTDAPPHLYNLCGHLHPAVVLKGAARQTLKLPCFFFGEKLGILPAFGAFTGTASLRPQVGDTIFGIAENQVFLLK